VKIAEMQAGRELDVMVAEKVMGWRWPVSADRGSPLGVRDHWRDDANKTVYLPEQLPYFSNDDASAWQVVDELHHQGLKVTVVVDSYSDTVLANIKKLNRTIADATASTMPLAVCQAALMALEAP
jgi:hypothetical protein